MLRMRNCFLFVILLGFVLLLAACAEHTIAEIKADPASFEDKNVEVAGVVTQSFSALGRGVYEIKDQTGEIYVASQKGVPSEGARVKVKGEVVNAFSFAGQNYGTVIVESSRKVLR